jgi:acyl phosphate:glycerol-3-phosphate acyltransferase
MLWPAFIALAFLAGSIPFGLIIGRARGIDIRQHGSKNIGATNVGRVLGTKLGLLCFALDVAKGLLPTLAAGLAAGLVRPTLLDLPIDERVAWLWLTVMAASVLGHTYSPWVRFKGGKGVATGLGGMLGVFPYLAIPALLAFALWTIVLKLSRYVSLASIVAAAALPLLVLAWAVVSRARLRESNPGSLIPFYVVSALLAFLVIWRHRANISRLLAGTENKIGARRPGVP